MQTNSIIFTKRPFTKYLGLFRSKHELLNLFSIEHFASGGILGSGDLCPKMGLEQADHRFALDRGTDAFTFAALTIPDLPELIPSLIQPS